MDKRTYFERLIPSFREAMEKDKVIDTKDLSDKKSLYKTLKANVKKSSSEVLMSKDRLQSNSSNPQDIARITEINELSEKIAEQFSSKQEINDAIQKIRESSKQYTNLTNIRRQEFFADLISKSSFLVFRVATAIGIALVIIGTSYLAKELKIALPLLKLG